MNKEIDVVVIGAGQAGLAMGYYLMRTKRSFVLVDASERVGDVWRNRYHSLVLFSPRAYSSLPGMALVGDPEGFPTKDEFANYLELYSHHFSIPVRLNTSVIKLEHIDVTYRLSTTQGVLIAKNVVIATGPFQKPFIPKLPGIISNRIFQIHSSEYRNPSQLPIGPVLVVGSGNSGTQIAAELSNSRPVCLSTGHKIVFIPRRILNRSMFWWLDATGLSKVSENTKFAKILKKSEPVIGMEVKSLIKSGKVKVKERVISLGYPEVEFIDGSKESVDCIVWATGFQYDYSWIHIPGVLDNQNKPIHRRGICPVKGIYFLGLPWLSRIGSAQINGVAYDARYLNEHLIK